MWFCTTMYSSNGLETSDWRDSRVRETHHESREPWTSHSQRSLQLAFNSVSSSHHSAKLSPGTLRKACRPREADAEIFQPPSKEGCVIMGSEHKRTPSRGRSCWWHCRIHAVLSPGDLVGSRRKNHSQEKSLSVPGLAPEGPSQTVLVLTVINLRRESCPKDF